MGGNQIRLIGLSGCEVIFFLDPADSAHIANRMIKKNISIRVGAGKLFYRDMNHVITSSFTADGKAALEAHRRLKGSVYRDNSGKSWAFHADETSETLHHEDGSVIGIAPALSLDHCSGGLKGLITFLAGQCPTNYEFHGVGACLNTSLRGGKFGNIEIKFRPRGIAAAADANPDCMIIVNVHLNQSSTSTKSFVDHTLRASLAEYLKDAHTVFGKDDNDIAHLRSAAAGLSQCASSGHPLTNANLLAYEAARAAAAAPPPPAVASDVAAAAAPVPASAVVFRGGRTPRHLAKKLKKRKKAAASPSG